MKKFNSSISKEKELCKKCVKNCKNKDGSALVKCSDYKKREESNETNIHKL